MTRFGLHTFPAAAVVVALAAGLAACGGGDEPATVTRDEVISVPTKPVETVTPPTDTDAGTKTDAGPDGGPDPGSAEAGGPDGGPDPGSAEGGKGGGY